MLVWLLIKVMNNKAWSRSIIYLSIYLYFLITCTPLHKASIAFGEARTLLRKFSLSQIKELHVAMNGCPAQENPLSIVDTQECLKVVHGHLWQVIDIINMLGDQIAQQNIEEITWTTKRARPVGSADSPSWPSRLITPVGLADLPREAAWRQVPGPMKVGLADSPWIPRTGLVSKSVFGIFFTLKTWRTCFGLIFYWDKTTPYLYMRGSQSIEDSNFH
jgi:hypothetical protein